MDAQQTIIKWIISKEGGYVAHPNDPGGETKYGISKRSYPELDIKHITPEQAFKIYVKDFYNKVVDEHMDFGQAAFMADTAVNMGIGTARRMWQDGSGELKQMVALRLNRYEELIKKNPKLAVFRNGWKSRVTQLIQLIEAHKN